MKTYTQVRFGIIFSATWEMWNFGIQKRKLTQLVDQAKTAVARKREFLCADRLDQGALTSYSVNDIGGNYAVSITGGNSVALFSSSQTREDGGTANSNIVYDGTTYNMDLEYDALKALHRTASLVKDPKGKPMNIDVDTLIVARGTTNYFRAMEMLRTIEKGNQPATADRESPGVPSYKIIALPWLQDNTGYWYGQDSKMKNDTYGLQYKENKAISLEGPNVVFNFWTPLWETIVEKFRKFREYLLLETTLSEVL